MTRLERARRYAALLGQHDGAYAYFLDLADPIVVTNERLEPPSPVIEFVNPAFERLSGFGRDALIGRDPRIMQGFHTDPQELHRMRATLEAGGEFEGEVVNYRDNGEEYVMGWVIVPVMGQGGTVRQWLSVQNDVTRDMLARRAG